MSARINTVSADVSDLKKSMYDIQADLEDKMIQIEETTQQKVDKCEYILSNAMNLITKNTRLNGIA